MNTIKQSVEIFHLLFLAHLEKKLDKSLYSLKGGCNLRFFFKSIRYSEDIDFDIQKIAKDTLQNKIDKLLALPAFKQNLRTKGLEIISVSKPKPKQTETTQRWKLNLKAKGMNLPLPTKIEFSRRGMNETAIFEPIEPAIIHEYSLYPIIVNHYTLQSSFEQKIQALIHRTETQARDVFDLKLLLEQGAKAEFLSIETKNKKELAVENALSISFSEFKSQVVAFLMKEYQTYYDSEKVWYDIQGKVINALEGIV